MSQLNVTWQYQCHHQVKPMKPILCCFRFLLRYWPAGHVKESPFTTIWNVIQLTHGTDLHLPSPHKSCRYGELCGWEIWTSEQRRRTVCRAKPNRVQMQNKHWILHVLTSLMRLFLTIRAKKLCRLPLFILRNTSKQFATFQNIVPEANLGFNCVLCPSYLTKHLSVGIKTFSLVGF